MMPSTDDFAEPQVLNARGLLCPEPLMLLHGKIAELAEGAVLEVITTDEASRRDIALFCLHLGHKLLKEEQGEEEETPPAWHLHIQKGA